MRLPNAPLVEAVFELKWDAVENLPNGRPAFGFDPGFLSLIRAFDRALESRGFNNHEFLSVGQPTILHSILKRYRKAELAFPLIQLGHGIFAANYSTDYEWTIFRDFCLKYLELLRESYPPIADWQFRPTVAELRYIDVFNKELMAGRAFTEFLNAEMDAKLQVPFFQSNEFAGPDLGRFTLTRALRSDPSTKFSFECHTGGVGDNEGVVATTRVIKTIESGAWNDDLTGIARNWLELAHSVTSPFFQELVGTNLMQKFQNE